MGLPHPGRSPGAYLYVYLRQPDYFVYCWNSILYILIFYIAGVILCICRFYICILLYCGQNKKVVFLRPFSGEFPRTRRIYICRLYICPTATSTRNLTAVIQTMFISLLLFTLPLGFTPTSARV